MAEKEEGIENVPRGNEWEVVSLTASAYAAAPIPEQGELTNDDNNSSSVKRGDVENAEALIMSRHFVFPPSEHENLPLEHKNVETGGEHGTEHAGSKLVEEFGVKSGTKNEEKLNINVSEEYPGIPIFDEKGNILSASGTEFRGGGLPGLNLVVNKLTFYDVENKSTTVGESTGITELSEFSSNQSLDSDLPMHTEKDKCDEPNLPCEAWWKRNATYIYQHAREANAFWSIFVAAAVMGIVIIGQRFQQERWQVLQVRWQSGVNDGTMSRMLRPLSRFRDMLVGGSPRGSFISGSSSAEH